MTSGLTLLSRLPPESITEFAAHGVKGLTNGDLCVQLVRDTFHMGDRRYSRETRQEAADFAASRNLTASWCLAEYWHYLEVLPHIHPDDVVWDACAGNMALSVLLAPMCQRVFAVEVDPWVVAMGLRRIGHRMPPNLVSICGDVRELRPPEGTTLVVCLAEHWDERLPDWKRVPRRFIRTRRGNETP